MRLLKSRSLNILLILILTLNFLLVNFIVSPRVEAGFLDEHKGSLITILKGIVMVWLINIMTGYSDGDSGNENIITSFIKNGLNPSSDETEDGNSDTSKEEVNQKATEPGTGDSKVVINGSEKVLNVRETKLLRLVNNYRKEKGLGLLRVDKKLVKLARLKARDMMENDYFEHNSPVTGVPSI